MGSNSPESSSPKPGGLLARLFGPNAPGKPADNKTKSPADQETEEPPVLLEAAPATPAAAAAGPEPVPLTASIEEAPDEAAVAVVEPLKPASPAVVAPVKPAVVAPVKDSAPTAEVKPPAKPAPVVEAPAVPQLCPICSTPRKGNAHYCDDCGWMFPAGWTPAATAAGNSTQAAPAASTAPAARLKDRYELGDLQNERGGVSRYRGLDYGAATPQAVPVVLVRMASAEIAEVAEVLETAEEVVEAPVDDSDDLDILPSFDAPGLTAMPEASVEASGPAWPSIAWEKDLLEKIQDPAMPRVVDSFTQDGFDYLVLEVPTGRSLWDAWDDPDQSSFERYGLLVKVAEALQEIHESGAIFEALRPDLVVVGDDGQARFTDLGDLLPLPPPPDLAVRVGLYTPPELVLTPDSVDARADLYSFGAMLYALEYLHHDLAETDFERPFSPKLITDRCPDVHPTFFRIINKTFCRDLNTRFPTDEAIKEDATGFSELIRTLQVCGRSFDNVRFDIAAWTTTGMVRTGNEDAFALLHAVESRQDELTEYAVLLLADGMGGYEAGEVAAAMAIQELRKNLLQQPMFSALAGGNAPAEPFNVETCKQLLLGSLKHANREVYTASRTPGKGKRGMGCTAEAVYVDAQNIVVGHVGDSRTYHLREGQLVQMTRDQTFVNRMVELGALTAAEAEDHPRKNELQQAIGGQPDVQPGVYQGKLKRGDWVLVCSDGLSNHIPPEDLQKMLLREATSAEEAARRLLNLVNLRGATDNATVVIIRAC